MKKIFNSRFFVIIVLAVLICTVFTSCVGSQTAKTKSIVVTPEEGNPVTKDTLSAIATVIYNNAAARNEFVAAYRGYDVLGDDKDATDFTETKEINLAAAKKVIEKYATSVEAASYEALDADDVKSIVLAMQDTIELNVNRDLISNISYYIGLALGWLTKTVGFGNYLVGICIFAIIIELFMLPLSIKQQKNSIKQASLRPKEMAIRNRYKGRNDQATQQKAAQEIQDLYQRENFNPMSGCLPMLIQLPIIMVLYNIVVDPIVNMLGSSASFANALKVFATSSKAAGGLGMTLNSTNGTIELLSKIKGSDLSALADFAFFNNSADVFGQYQRIASGIPSFNVGPINLGLNPSFDNIPLLIVPVLTFVVYFFTMKISKKFTYQPTQNDQAPGAGCSTKAMEWYMPIVSTMFCFMVPGAVGIYWLFRSILSTFKSFIMSKVMPLPRFTEEDYKEAERELNAKKPQRKRKNASSDDPDRERPRSLHHIDDDDEEYITFVNKD